MVVEFFHNDRSRLQSPYISVDPQGRIYLSKQTQELFGSVGVPIHLLVGYDTVNQRIGLAKPDLVKVADTAAYKFNGQRAYASCRAFLEKSGLLPTGKSVRYLYDGEEYNRRGVHLFRKENAVALDDPQNKRGRGRPSRASQLAALEAKSAAEETAATETKKDEGAK